MKPSQSSSPEPRSPTPEEEAVTRLFQRSTLQAYRTLVSLLTHADGQLRCAAATALLERGWGRSPVTLEISAAPTAPVDLSHLTDEELDQLEALTQRVHGGRNAVTGPPLK